MWAILKKAGVHPALINIIHSFNDLMTALSLPDAEVHPIDVRNGLRQGYCMAPVLFNIFMWAVIQLWTCPVEEFDDVALSVLYNTGIRGIMGISQRDVWEQHLSMSTIFQAWNGPNTRNIDTRLGQRCLEWLGHVCQMPEHRSKRKWLFGSLLSRRPACGPRLRWRDLGRRNVRDNACYPINQVQPEWRQFYTAQCDDAKPPKHINCEICGRSFRQQANCNRHKCSAERALPVRFQAGSRQCSRCGRWFKSAGGISAVWDKQHLNLLFHHLNRHLWLFLVSPDCLAV